MRMIFEVVLVSYASVIAIEIQKKKDKNTERGIFDSKRNRVACIFM